MKSELIVDVQPTEVSIALVEDSRLVSLQKESRNVSYAVGDIYLAKVKKLMPGLNAAFVNVGYEKDAFLHYLDLGSQYSSYSFSFSLLFFFGAQNYIVFFYFAIFCTSFFTVQKINIITQTLAELILLISFPLI